MRHILTVLMLVLTAENAARADESSVVLEARTSFREGLVAFDDGRISDALVAFERAYSLRPSFKLLFNIGHAQAELGLLRQAVESFEQYLQEGGDKIEPNRKLEVEAELSRLRISAGMSEVGPSKGGQAVDLDLDSRPGKKRFLTKVAPWLFGGLAVATAACGTAFGIRAVSLNNTLDSNCNAGGCPPKYADDIDSMNGSALAADVLLVSTALLTGTVVSIVAVTRHNKKKGESQ